MLNHEQPEDQTVKQTAAQVRVAPEELAAAIARLEARRAGNDGKIAIGDAVSELSLDATPEEVLAEVRAGQVHVFNQEQATQQRQPAPFRRRILFAFATGAAALGVISLFGMRIASPRVDIASISPAANLSPPPQRILLNPNLPVGDTSGQLVLLSEVGDNHPVHCTYSSGSFQQYSSDSPVAWTLIKHSGKVYVRGWILKMSPAVMAHDGVDVSTVKGFDFVVPVTLAVDGFNVSDPGNSNAQFHAASVQLDRHAYEKWNP